MRISCLHTTPMNISAYEAAAPAGVALTHHLRSDLMHRAERGVDAGLAAETNMYLKRIMAGSDAALLTCSVLAEAVAPPAFAADALLAKAAASRAAGKTIDVFYSNPFAQPAVAARFDALPGAADIRIIGLPGALDLLRRGDEAGHDALVAAAVAQSDADLIVLVQATLHNAVPASPRILGAAQAALAQLSRLRRAA